MDRPELTTSTPLAFVDIETTGGHHGRHRVIDVAVIGATDGVVDFEWQSLVNPGVRVPAGITALTGIDNGMLEGAPGFEDIAAELRERLAGRVFVAHNVRFDYGFIRREFARLGHNWRSPSLCTVRLSRALYPEIPHHNLDSVMERHGIVIENRHRAMPDAQVLLEFWRRLRAGWPEDDLVSALGRAAPRIRLPATLSEDLLDDLPEEPGVYRFFGAGDGGDDTLLYVGKANNLRERVLDYFREGANEARVLKIASQARRVSWTETAGELGAQLLESREVREMHPVYNRAARGSGERFTWLLSDEPEAPRLASLDADALRTGNAYGSYRSERDARHALESLAREHRWCLKLLGLVPGTENPGEGSCLGYQVGRCRGACVGKEPAGVHFARVKIELACERLEPWPHEGPVIVHEGSGERRTLHVLDAWQHLASVPAAEAPDELEGLVRRAARDSGAFDIDTWRILRRLLRNPRYRAQPLPRREYA